MKVQSGSLVSAVAGTAFFFAGNACADNPAIEAEIVEKVRDHALQGRSEVIVDPVLSLAAQVKANDLINRNYLAHVNPDGYGPNFLIQAFDYFFPADYVNTRVANNVESIFQDIGFGPPDAELAFQGWLNSSFHRTHVLAENAFFGRQTHVGVGVATDVERLRNIYVFFSAAPPGPRDVLAPELLYNGPAETAKAERMMVHHGQVFDPQGISLVQVRIQDEGWVTADYSAATGTWSAWTYIARKKFYKRVRDGKRALIFEVRAMDESGNWSYAGRQLKNKKKKKKKRNKRNRGRQRR